MKSLKELLEAEAVKEKQELQKVRDYLRQNPSSSAMDIAQKTGMSVSNITKFMRQGALHTKEG